MNEHSHKGGGRSYTAREGLAPQPESLPTKLTARITAKQMVPPVLISSGAAAIAGGPWWQHVLIYVVGIGGYVMGRLGA